MVADLVGRHQKRNASEHPRHEQRPSESQLEKQEERRCHQHRAGRRDGRSQRQRGETLGTKSDSETVDEQIEKKGGKNSAVHNARVDPGPRRRTWDRAPQRKLARKVPETFRDTEVKETNQSGFDRAGVKSLLHVEERDKGVLVAAEAQGVHETEGHGVGTPAPPWEVSVVGERGEQCEHR